MMMIKIFTLISLLLCGTLSLLASEPEDLMELSIEDIQTMVTTVSQK